MWCRGQQLLLLLLLLLLPLLSELQARRGCLNVQATAAAKGHAGPHKKCPTAACVKSVQMI
jgi:hypothetical protein